MKTVPGCEFCEAAGAAAAPDGTTLVARNDTLRVVRVHDAPSFPAFYRVIWGEHRTELTELAAPDRARCLDAVCRVEEALRRHLKPTKINLASLGNVTPHLHWHVIARFDWDSHYPRPIWGAAQRADDDARLGEVKAVLPEIDAAIVAALAA